MLEIENLGIGFRRYGSMLRRVEVEALANVSLSVAPGELIGVVGASGAGKSLLAHAIFGVLPRNARVSGRMRFDGAPLDEDARNALRGRRMALVPQSIGHLDPLVRAGRQVEWAAGRAGLARTEGLAEAALARFDLGPGVVRVFPHALSGGMARRVMLAMASAGAADLVVADEPTNGLDPDNAAIVLGHLRGLADAGRAVIVITHDLVATLAFADRVAILRGGRLVETAPASAFTGTGEGLGSHYGRTLWRALPANGFVLPEGAA